MISITNLHLSFGMRPILQGLDLSIQDGECLAIVGPNGCGKSTFLRILAGIEHPDAGEINMPNRSTIGYLPQEAEFGAMHSLEEELLDSFAEVRAALAEMQTLEHTLADTPADSPEHDRAMRRYGECAHLVEHQDGYSLESQVRRVASGLGFAASDLGRSCAEFSGGWRMRILLAQLLLRKPDVLLLDEPTNHLDLETTLWLENWIKTCRRTVVLVTHERATMDRLADRIVCLESGLGEVYPGDYSRYLEIGAARRQARWDAYEKQKEEIETAEAFIRRFRYNAARASLVQSRIKLLDKVERLEPPFHPTAIHFKFPAAPHSHGDVLTAEHLGHRYGSLRVFSDLNVTIRRGEKVGLVGVNGAGKSTLLRILAGREQPTEGTCTVGGKVSGVFFAQYDSSTLTSEESLLQAIQNGAPTGQANRSRDLLGAFLFSGDDVEKPLRTLSGGERTRFRLAQMLFSPANLLLLDEPTNHLDVTSRATVEMALQHYTGTVVVVSHDRVFMDRVTNRILELDGGVLRDYPGSYGDYLKFKERQLAEAESEGDGEGMSATSKATGGDKGGARGGSGKGRSDGEKGGGAARPELSRRSSVGAPAAATPVNKEERLRTREERKALERQARSLEKKMQRAEAEVERLEAHLKKLDEEMARPHVASDFSRLNPLLSERAETVTKRDAAMAEWERLHEEFDALG
jgi:ATP-binding cassette subfamily F protein 3